jgi:PAS domain S-box-containing protein
MNDSEKSKDQLIEELEVLRQRVADQVKKEEEYKRIERDFKTESAQRQSLLEGVSNFVIFQLVQDKKDPAILHVAFVSPSAKEILGISEPYRIKTLFEIMHPEDVERVRSANQKAIETKKFNEIYRIYHSQKREWRWIRAISTGRPDETGGTEYINGILFDITEQKNTEEALRKSHENLDLLVKEKTEELKISEERFRMVAEITDDALFEWDLATNKAWRSEAYHKVFGYREIPDRFDWWTERIHPDDRSRILEKVKTVIKQGGKSWGEEYRFQKADGSFAHVFDRCYIVRNPEGDPIRFVGSMMDISGRKRLEGQLQQSEEMCRALFEEMAQGAFLQRADGALLDVNSAALRMFGLTREEFLGRTSMHPDWDVVNEDGSRLPAPEHPSMRALRMGEPVKGTVAGVFNSQSRSRVWMEINATPEFRPGETKPHQVMVTLHDLTERKKAEEALKESEAKYRDLFNSMNEGMALHEVIYDEQGRAIDYLIVDVNPAFEKQTGLPTETVKNQPAGKIYGMESPPFLDIYAKVAGTGTPTNFEIYFPPLKRNFKVAVFSPKQGWFATIFEDITQQKAVMEALKEREVFYQAIFEQAGDGVLILDTKGKIISVNKKFAEIHGYTDEEVLNYGLAKIDVEGAGPIPDRINRILAGQTLNFEVEHYHKDGQIFPVMVTANLISTEHEQFILAIHRDISERKRMEEELRGSEERYRILFEKGADGIVILDPRTTRLIEFNDRACYQLGYTREEFAKLKLADIDAIESTEETRERIDNVIKGGFGDFETLHRNKSGEIRNVHVAAQTIETKKGLLYYCIWRDITDPKRSEEILRLSEEKFSKSFHHAPILMTISVPENGLYVDVNDKFCEVSGFSREEAIGKSSVALGWLRAEDRKKMTEELRNAGKVLNKEMTLFAKDGRLVVCLVNIEQIMVNDQPRLLTLALDITERKGNEDEHRLISSLIQQISLPGDYRKTIQTLATMLQHWSGFEAVGIRLRDGEDFPYYETRGFPSKFVESERHLCSYDWQGQLLRDEAGNPVLECMCGNIICGRFDQSKPFFTEKGSFWTNSTTTLLTSTTETDRQARTRNRCNGEGYESVGLIPLRAGEERFGLIQFNDHRPNRFTSEGVARLERIAENLANALSRRLTEQALRESEDRFRMLSEKSPLGISLIDAEGRFAYVNPAFLNIFGYDQSDIPTSKVWFQTVFPDPENRRKFGESLKADLERNSDLEVISHTYEVKCKDGSIKTILFRPIMLRSRKQFIIYEDITERIQAEAERRKLEEHLLRAEKMEALGTLAGGIAHDFNNILGAIIGYVQLTDYDLPENSEARYNLSQVLKASERARDLVKQILAFSRQDARELSPLHILPVIKEVIKLLRASLPTSITIEQKLDLSEDTILGNPTQIHQVVMNLCTNAAQAMKNKKGVIKISLEKVDLDIRDKRTFPDLVPGSYLKLSISDTGEGINPKILPRIFDPFFTTKKPGEGTGMGLSVTHGIVKSYKGEISVFSEPGIGSTFQVYLPLINPVTNSPGKAQDSLPIGNERILLVDDEAWILDSLFQMLKRLGYEVSSQVDPLKALEAFRANPDRFDLVITDMTMPHMDGMELAQELLSIRPSLPIIMCSGYGDALALGTGKNIGIRKFLMKPILFRDIAMTVREALDGKNNQDEN